MRVIFLFLIFASAVSSTSVDVLKKSSEVSHIPMKPEFAEKSMNPLVDDDDSEYEASADYPPSFNVRKTNNEVFEPKKEDEDPKEEAVDHKNYTPDAKKEVQPKTGQVDSKDETAVIPKMIDIYVDSEDSNNSTVSIHSENDENEENENQDILSYIDLFLRKIQKTPNLLALAIGIFSGLMTFTLLVLITSICCRPKKSVIPNITNEFYEATMCSQRFDSVNLTDKGEVTIPLMSPGQDSRNMIV
ncbi:unnamed protein product [Caenorhabditis bovis]|uniref:Nematode cuticle collagen N-terminal domain-containing protein n=1 Tax=Caenorhabditis bovis TaxID=2654633 RepID=A0A8S1FBL7_9PELO|nr:unnamed protein product [Caenorhabditis bovis]